MCMSSWGDIDAFYTVLLVYILILLVDILILLLYILIYREAHRCIQWAARAM